MSANLVYTPVDEIERVHDELRKGFASGKLKSIAYRKYQLLQLAYLVKDNAKQFEEALASDLGRPALESKLLEIGATIAEAKTCYESVEKWAKPESTPFSMNFTPMRPVIRKEPKGAVLIISPFNYPLWLALSPACGAIAAGNTVCIKPSEQTPAVSSLLAELIPKYLDTDLFKVVNGGIPETTKVLDLHWDHILYTGGERVAKIVSQAAAKHLTPVSLELGGKSPVIIDPKCDLQLAARRILWGKFVNAGQTCVAPDYVLVPRDFQDQFVEALKQTYAEFYPASNPPSEKGNYGRLISVQAWNRVNNLLKNSKGQIVLGGEANEATKYIAPTVVKSVTLEDSLMSEEIFGPLLPIVPVNDVNEAIEIINARGHPLALYVFSQDAHFKSKVFDNTQSGAAIANEVVLHPGADGLPFGGIGPSGSGYHTGKFGFDMFTHFRASMDSPGWLDRILGARFPPYTSKKETALAKLTMPKLPARPTKPPALTALTSTSPLSKWFFLSLALAAVGVLTRQKQILRALVAAGVVNS